MARRPAQPNARYVTPATTGEIFGRVGTSTLPGSNGMPGRPSGPYARTPGAPARPTPPGRRKRFIDYPRFGREGWRRWVPSWKLVGGLFGLGLAMMVVAFVTAYASTEIPPQSSLVNAQTTVIYYADGKTEIGRMAEQNRQIVKLGQVPKHVQNAVIAAEDRSFYSNSGVNPTSIVRAAWANARGKPLQGGSTITQQYVKNYFDLRDRTVSRKAKEFFIALRISRDLNKDEILEGYLNTIYFGRGAYGVQAASKAYFNKNVADLNVSEAAFLAGIINSPENYDPADGDESIARATTRWNYVANGMAELGFISQPERAEAAFPTKFAEPRKSNSLGGARGYLMAMAQDAAMADLTLDEDRLRTGGFKIVTTFDPKMVEQATETVKEQLPKKRPAGLQIGMATIDPRTGAVRSIYGGEDYLARQRNAATQDRAQAGSTFKPFGLVAALEDGISLRSRYSGRSPMDFDGVEVGNFGGSDYGQIDLLTATANSVNTVYVALNEEVGPEKAKDVALRAGIPDDDATNVQDNLVNVLGSASPHPLDMASAYGTFANGGNRVEPYVIQSVSIIETGELFHQHKIESKPVFDPEVIADATYAMEQVVRRGSGSYAKALDRPVAGKTGTSSDALSAWFVGYTPQLVTAVAMYQNDDKGNPVKMKPFGNGRAVTGGNYPVRIWTEFMDGAMDGMEVMDFPKPEYGGKVINPAPKATKKPEPSRTPREQPTGQPDPGESENPRPTRDPRPDPTESEPGFTIFPPGDDDGGDEDG